MKEKMLNEAEILSIKRLREKKVSYEDIADRIGISVERENNSLLYSDNK